MEHFERLQVAYVTLTAVKVASFSVSDNVVSFEVHFNDGRFRHLLWKTVLRDPKTTAAKLTADLITLVEGEHCIFDGESLISCSVVLKDSHSTQLALAEFFRTVLSKLQKIKNYGSGEGYINLVKDIYRTEVKL